MSVAVDSSVLFAILRAESGHQRWLDRLAEEAAVAPLLACDVVWAEVGAFFSSAARLRAPLDLLEVRFDPIGAEAAHLAGRRFRAYRDAGGPRQHLIPDFLIAAHARCQADGLLAVERGFFRSHFRDLRLLGPAGERR